MSRIPLPTRIRYTVVAFALLPLLSGCRAEYASTNQKVTYGTHLVLLESGIHWGEWVKQDGTPCGDVYKWNDQWMADTYREGLNQRPYDTKDEAVAWVQKWCQ